MCAHMYALVHECVGLCDGSGVGILAREARLWLCTWCLLHMRGRASMHRCCTYAALSLAVPVHKVCTAHGCWLDGTVPCRPKHGARWWKKRCGVTWRSFRGTLRPVLNSGWLHMRVAWTLHRTCWTAPLPSSRPQTSGPQVPAAPVQLSHAVVVCGIACAPPVGGSRHVASGAGMCAPAFQGQKPAGMLAFVCVYTSKSTSGPLMVPNHMLYCSPTTC